MRKIASSPGPLWEGRPRPDSLIPGDRCGNAAPPGRHRRLSWALCAWMAKTLSILLILFAAGCGRKAGKTVQDVLTVRTETVAREDLAETIDYVGTIRARDEAEIYPRVTGKIVQKLKNEGDRVAKGETIALIDRDEVGFTFETAPVESSLSGVIGRIPVDLGTAVTPQTTVATVVDLDEAEVRLDVPEKYLPLLSPGLKCSIGVDAYPGESFPGTVTQVSPVLDVETRTAPAEITIPNADHRLKPGMFARVKIVARTFPQVPTVSQEAIVGRAPDAVVFLVEGETARLRRIVPGFKQGARVQVVEGLQGAETVIVMGQQRLKDGDRVRTDKNSAAAGPGAEK